MLKESVKEENKMEMKKKDELFKQYFKYKINYIIDNNIPNYHLDTLRVKYEALFDEHFEDIKKVIVNIGANI
jgi:uncharacterized membrane protein